MNLGAGRIAIGLALVLLCCCDFTLAIYRKFALKEWCQPSPVMKVVRLVLGNPKEFFVSKDNALRIVDRFDSTLVDDCNFVVDSDRGLILNVQNMYLRRSDAEESASDCIDYLRVKFSNGTKADKLCGPVNANTTGIRSFVDYGGHMTIKIRVDHLRKLHPREHLFIDLVFTQFEVCRINQGNQFPCDENLCIFGRFVNDGLINCPLPNCLDETGCTNRTQIVPELHTSKRAIIGGIASALVLVVGLSICSCIVCRYCRCRSNRNLRNNSSNSGRRSSGGGVGSGTNAAQSVPSRRNRRRSSNNNNNNQGNANIAAAYNNQRPQEILIGTNVNMPALAPPEEQKDAPPPTYESLFPDRR